MKALRRWVVLHLVFALAFAIQFVRMAAISWVVAAFVFHVPQSAPLWFLFSFFFADYMTGEFDLLVAKYRELR